MFSQLLKIMSVTLKDASLFLLLVDFEDAFTGYQFVDVLNLKNVVRNEGMSSRAARYTGSII